MKIDVDTKVPESVCCECGHRSDMAGGPCEPSPGDFSLCINCASLNIYDDDLRLRYPTEDEFLEAAADSDVQTMRRAILSIPRLQ